MFDNKEPVELQVSRQKPHVVAIFNGLRSFGISNATGDEDWKELSRIHRGRYYNYENKGQLQTVTLVIGC